MAEKAGGSTEGTLCLREMRVDDVTMVLEVETLSFPTPWSQAAFLAELLTNSYARYYVAAVGARVVGYGGMWLIIDEAHITNIAVHPGYRGRRIGEALLLCLIGKAREMKAVAMTLEVRANNVVAQNLYRKHGFVPRGLRRGYYSDTGEDAVIMWKDNL
ncbi:MAG: ribosomal protein S18-alanine N-acetyltransferase [bacterium]|jgi:ribosomal-protein-alanine N-acetyltransferase